MRKTSALDVLFPKVRRGVLAATLTQSEKWWYLSKLAQFLQTTPSSLQRELKALVASGILQQRREGTRAYVKAETRSLRRVTGLVEVVEVQSVVPDLVVVSHPDLVLTDLEPDNKHDRTGHKHGVDSAPHQRDFELQKESSVEPCQSSLQGFDFGNPRVSLG